MRTRLARLAVAVTSVLSAGVLLAACSANGGPAATAAAGSTPVKGGTITYAAEQ